MNLLNENNKYQQFFRKSDFDQFLSSQEFSDRYNLECFISNENINEQSWYIYGYCESCSVISKFKCDWEYSANQQVNFRERLLCDKCNLNNRQRLVVGYLRTLIKENMDVYLYEQITPVFKQLENICKSTCRLVGSEYLGPNYSSGQIINGVRHEDALKLSLSTSSMDLIVSNDVFEHVPDIHRSLSEAYRVLKPEGKLIFTIPFYFNRIETKRRCEIVDGVLKHYEPEEYHGNPVDSEKGSLVFYDYGWDILEYCKAAGFNNAFVSSTYAIERGYLGINLTFIAEK